MSDSDELKLPDTAEDEQLNAVAGALASLIPVVGGPATAIVAYAGQQRINNRQRAFLEAVVRRLGNIQAQVDHLSESFWSTLFYAAQAATRTHREEKLEALQNAAVNAALPGAPDDDLQHIFVTIIDELTPLHIRLLAVRLHPEKYGANVESYRGLQGLQIADPDWVWDFLQSRVSSRRDLIEQALKDLVNRGLLEYGPMQQDARLQRILMPEPTNFAWEFLTFITAPSQERS